MSTLSGKIKVIGAGPAGTAIALEFLRQGFSIKLITYRQPGTGITADQAAGIGAFVGTDFTSELNKLALASYDSWMQLARDPTCPSVTETRLTVIEAPEDPPWKDQVVDYRRTGPKQFDYTTFSFDPRAFGQERFQQIGQSDRAEVETRPLEADEIGLLRHDIDCEDCDHTVVAIGLNLRDIKPEYKLHPIRGVLAHFPPSPDTRSFDSAESGRTLYVVSRPGAQVVGGTYDEHVGTCSSNECEAIARRMLTEANEAFGTEFRYERLTKISVGYRPGGQFIVDVSRFYTFISGLGSLGWFASPELARHVVRSVRAKLGQ